MTADGPANDIQLAMDLKRLIASIEAGGHAVLPRSSDTLLQSIVEAAARIFGAAAASILLVNEKTQTLEFKVAYGAANRDLIGMSFPLDQGIAGYVAMTGQPIAVSDVQKDARFNQSFAKSTGYVPRSILAMPLLSNERVIGVMEVLDKISASSFGLQDMELLGMFARQAAIAIDQSQKMERIGEALVLGLRRLAGLESEGRPMATLVSALDHEELGAGDLLALADLFNEISLLGQAERKACSQILRAFAEYGRSRTDYATM
jgi:GAF domain-containing protein